jgi:hypothetical protein
MTDEYLSDIPSTRRLMNIVEHLSVVIGPRHPASHAEREAAAYIHRMVREMNGDWELINQPFRSVDGFRYRIAPLAALTGLSLLVGLRRERDAQIASGLLSVGLSIMSRDAFLARPAMWEAYMPRGESENVLVRIPPRGAPARRIVFVAHLDSGANRLTARPEIVRHLPRTLGAVTLLGLVGGVLTALAGRNQRWRTLRAAIAAAALGGTALSIADEMGPGVAGANGNASGVAALLGLADLLHAHPLDSTEVILAFTGSATAVSTGADLLASEYGDNWAGALWIVVSNVGAGELCWVTRHGISPYAAYEPHPDAVRLMERVADARPDLGMMGKPMITLDEVSNLVDRDLRAVGLMAYYRVTGAIPNWRRSSDTIHAITPETIARAVEALWTAAQVVDRGDDVPA